MTSQPNPLTAPSQSLDTVTVLWTAPGKLATKQFSKSSPGEATTVKSYDAGFLYSVAEPVGVNSIEELSTVLTFIEKHPRAFIIRGAPVSGNIIGKDVTRTGSGQGDGFEGNFKTPVQGRHFLEIDVDKFVLPKGWRLNRASIGKICQHIVHLLPPEFHDVSYHWQLSSSAGVFDNTKVSAHFWFWLARPVPDTALKAWARHVNSVAGIPLIDASLFQHVQPHYTAAPIFTGMPDPFPTRSGLVTKNSDSVDLQLAPPDVAICAPASVSNASFKTCRGQGFHYFLGQIGDHPGGDGFHGPIVQAAASYVAENGADGTDIQVLHSAIRQRVLNADASKHSPADVADRASDAQIGSAIDSAMRKFGNSANQRRKSRRIEGLMPHFQGDYQDVNTIQRSLDAILDSVF
jgi:hypothetical protein